MTRIFLVLLFISLSGFGLARQNSPKNDFEAALEAMDREDQEAAFFHLENWLKSYPQDALAHWYMGQVYESFPGKHSVRTRILQSSHQFEPTTGLRLLQSWENISSNGKV